MSIRILKGLYQFTVYTIGICVLLAAITATLIRFLLPDIGMYRTEIEAWVSNYMDFPVAIHTIEADWQGWTPHLYLNDIDLLNKAGTSPIINFDSAQVSIDLIATLIRRQIIPERLIISGFDINLTRQQDGSINIEGMGAGNNLQQNTGENELAEWLFGQRIIELLHARIIWLDETLGNTPVLLSDVNLILRSDGNRLQVEGSTPLPSVYGDHLSFAFDATGDLLTSDWSADLFVQGNNINPDFWYRKYWPADINVIGGNATVSIWSKWENASAVSMQGRLEYDNFEFTSDSDALLHVSKLDTRFSSSKDSDNNWLTNLVIDELVTSNGDWQPARISLLTTAGTSTYTLGFDYLKLIDLYPVLSTLSFFPANMSKLIDEYPLTGDLGDGRLMYSPHSDGADKLKFDITFNELGMKASADLPEISGLTGRARGSMVNGKISFIDEEAEIAYSAADVREVRPVIINGELAWSDTDQGYLIYTDRLLLANDEITTRLSGSVGLGNSCCYINIITETETTSVASFVNNIPYTASFRLRDWLQNAVHSGQVNSMKALFRGHAKNFPFDNHSGVFELKLDVSDASLSYSPRWPAIENIDSEIAFAGRVMTINIYEGSIFNASITTATATIPDLLVRQKTVNVDGRITGMTSDLKKYIGKSPLSTNQMLTKLVNSISADGGVDLDLNLSVPLRAPNKQTEINGKLKLAHTSLTTEMDDLQFTDINGEVLFTRNSLTADNLAARYSNHDVSLTVNADDANKTNPVTVNLSGKGDTDFILDQINRYFPNLSTASKVVTDRLTGSADWGASLTYTRNNAGATGLNRILKINSDLHGMDVSLPQPLTKHAYIKTRLEITKHLDEQQVPLKISYGNILSSEILFDAITGLQKADINFGNKTYMYPEHNGILLYGEIDQMALDDWFAILVTRNQDAKSSDSIAVQSDLKFNNLISLGQTFTDVNMQASHDDENWNIALAGDAVNGEIIIPIGTDKEKPIIVNLENLRLQKLASGGDSKRINPATLPSITAQVKSFHYGTLDLGKMEFIAGAAEYGLYIDTLSFSKPSFTIEANGKWNGTDNLHHSSDFTIQAHALEFDKMLETFGYDVAAVRKGETNFAIDANWDGSPMEFSLDKLNGSIGLKIGKGQLLDIQPSAGRLFGLLSLQTLPRRLTLDFSDLFGDGMAFDRIEGNFMIKNGDAYTEDLVMKGPSVDIAISGRAGLVTHDYDQIAVITPQISDSLAVASGFLGPMGIGLGTILYLAGNIFEPLQNSINKIMQFKYSISGSWNDPLIEKHKNQPASSG